MKHPKASLSALLISTIMLAATASAEDSESRADPAFELEELKVTGGKLGRTLQETQDSVAFWSGGELSQSTATSIFDVFERTANTFATDGGFTIRGIPNTGFAFSEGGAMATVLVDGAQIDSQMLSFDGLPLWDVSQVEILRGPQSTTHGRNSLAGAVVVRTKNPTFHWDMATRASYADYDTYQLAAAAGGPLIDDTLAFRLSVDRQSSDGAITNLTRGEDDWARTDTLGFRGKLLLEPKQWDGFSALLTYSQTDSKNGERAYANAANFDGLFDRVTYENTRNDFDSRSRLASLEINQRFGNDWKLTSLTTWSDFASDALYDGDRTAEEDLVYGFGYDNETASQELRLLAERETWTLLAGLYAAKETRGYHSDGPFYYIVPSPLDAVFGLPSPARALLTVEADSKNEVINTAVFLNGDWKPSERWTLTAGVRLNREETDRESSQNVLLLEGFPDAVALMDVPSLGIPAGAPADVVLQGIAAEASAAGDGKDTFNTVLPSAGIIYHWTGDMSTGFTVTRGYRSGGVTFNQRRATIVPFDPEYTWNYELSFRSQWLEKRVTANANIFYVDWTDQQVPVQLSSDIYDRQVENAGRSRYYGFELELRERLNGGWSFFQSIGHTRTKFEEFLSSAGDFSGNEFPEAPRWTLGAGLSYSRGHGWFGNSSIHYVTDTYGGPDNLPELRPGQRLLLNAKFGFAHDYWSAYVFGTNLLDDEYAEALWAGGLGYEAVLGAPRIIGIGLEASY